MGKCCEWWVERIGDQRRNLYRIPSAKLRIHLSFPGKTSVQFFVHFSKKMITSSLEESRPKPSRKTAVRQQQQPLLFTFNTEPSQLCRHSARYRPSRSDWPVPFSVSSSEKRRQKARPPWLQIKFAALGASRFLG